MESNGRPVVMSRTCGSCDEPLEIQEALYLVEVVRPYHDTTNEQRYHRHTNLATQDYVHSPYFFHESCWDDILLRLEEELSEHQFVADPDPRSTYTCRCCGEGVREEELACLETAGRFRVSSRQPNNQPTAAFEEMEEPRVLCIGCAIIINTTFPEFDEHPLWVNLQEDKECRGCTYSRCWRDASCDCECHRP